MEETRQKDETNRLKQEEEWKQRDKELRLQMELLAKITDVKKAESTEPSKTGDDDLQFVKFNDRDDVEAYLTTFEWLMGSYNIPDYTEARQQTTKDDQPTGFKPSTKDEQVTTFPGTRIDSQSGKEDGEPPHTRDKQPFRPRLRH